MADVLGKKISELAETTDLAGLYTIGSDRNNQSKKVPLQFVKEAADYANAQGDYAKGVGDTIQGNTGVNEYPAFSSSTQYAAGSVVHYNNKLYRFTALHPAGAWVGTDAIETSIKAETDVKLTELESNVGKNLLSYFVAGRCAVTGSVGEVAKIERIPGSSAWAYLLISVLKGQIFKVTSRGNELNPSWAVLDSNKVLLSKASENRQENVNIEIEQNGYLVMNALLDNSYYKDTDYDVVWLNPSSMASNIDNVEVWITSEAFQVTSAEYSATGDIISADIVFPDRTEGKITITRNADGLVTKLVGNYGNQNYTYNITRNAEGGVVSSSFNHSLYPNW